jgi:hypothetical protein
MSVALRAGAWPRVDGAMRNGLEKERRTGGFGFAMATGYEYAEVADVVAGGRRVGGCATSPGVGATRRLGQLGRRGSGCAY